LTIALAVGEGGTGGTTAGAARTSLGAAASGANADITSLTGLTTALAVGEGGTGATTTAAARTSLGAAASGANADITSLTGLTIALAVSEGGTGGTTASAARTSLGAAASGANTDITSLTGLTVALAVSEGGTGAATASAGTIFGNFGSSTSAPAFNSPGSNNQIIGVVNSGSGLEWKSISAGSNITVTPASGSITIAFSNPLTTLGDTVYGGSSGALTRLAGTTSSTKHFLTQTGSGSASAAPAWGTLATTDLPSSVVTSTGNLSPLFTSSIASQALSFSLSNAGAGTIFGNFSTSSAAPSYQSSGSANQVLGVQTGGSGLEFKTIAAGANVTVTNTAGEITIAAAASGSFPLINQCRLYGMPSSSGASPNNCYTDTSSSGTSTLYFGPCPDKGNSLFLYSSGAWGRIAVSEVNIGVSALSTNTYDVYVYNNGGSVAIDTLVGWSGGSPPTRDIDTTSGVLVKHGDSTRLYVGSVQVISGIIYSFTGYRGIWNAYNRVQAPISAYISTADWTYSGGWRNADGNSSYGGAIIGVVTGMQIEPVNLVRFSKGPDTSYTIAGLIGIAVDGTNPTPSTGTQGVGGEMFATSYTAGGIVTVAVPFTNAQIGVHTYQAIEYGGGSCAFWGGIYGGMFGTTFC